MQAAQNAKEDYHYTCEGTQALFIFFDLISGWRLVTNLDSLTSIN